MRALILAALLQGCALTSAPDATTPDAPPSAWCFYAARTRVWACYAVGESGPPNGQLSCEADRQRHLADAPSDACEPKY